MGYHTGIRMSSPGGGAPAPQYDPIEQLIAQLSQQYAGGVGTPPPRGIDLRDYSELNYTDVNLGGQYKRLWYEPAPGPRLDLPNTFTPPVAEQKPQGRYFTNLTDLMVNPTTGKQGMVRGWFGEDGSFQSAEWRDNKTSWLDNLISLAPALILGAATMGAGGLLSGIGGGAGAAGGAAGGTGLTAGAGGITGLTAGAGGITGLTAPAGFMLAPEIGAGLIGAAGANAVSSGGADYSLTGGGGNFGGQGLQAPGAPQAGSMGGAGTGLTPGAGGAGGLGGAGILDTMKTLATYAGPAASLLSSAQTVGAVNDLQAARMPALRQPEVPPVPAAQANPAARGYQAASNPITSVLGRNREANRNRTMLTGPRGVNMDSVRVGGNSLLGM